MSNVEVVRRGFTAFNDRLVDDLVALCDPLCEWVPFRAQLEGMVYRGHAGIRQFVRDMDEDWETFRIDPSEFHERGALVGAVAHVSALGRGSGVRVASDAGFVFELRVDAIAFD